MAKKQSRTSEQKAEASKKPGAGAAIGSIVFFILTFLMASVLLCSSTLYLTFSQNSLTKTIDRTDLSAVQLTDDGVRQDLGSWVYRWYMEGAPNLTPEFAQAALRNDAVKGVFTAYCTDLGQYLMRETNDLPMLDAEKLADAMQQNSLSQETGVTFLKEDRSYFLWATGEDIPEWNNEMHQIVGTGIGKVMIRFFCTLPGVITAGTLTLLLFVLWIIFAVKGHWRKGKMLTGYGVAVALPNALALLSCGILLLLVTVLDAIPTLSFAIDSLPVLLVPMIWPSLAYTLGGALIASIGICANGVAKSKRVVSDSSVQASEPASTATSAEPAETPQEPDTEPTTAFTYQPFEPQKETVQAHAEVDNAPSAGTTCPHCGAPVTEGSKFCGSCGGVLS